MRDLQLLPGKKFFFASDFHFGIPNKQESLNREKRICAWLEKIQPETQALFLLGDVFDAWIEYKRVVPAGFVRFLGKLAAFQDAGIPIFVFTGNHDLWMRGYLQEEVGAEIHKQTLEIRLAGKHFVLAHGDGLHASEGGYLWMKKLFHHPFSQWLYRKLHPDWGVGIADYFSRRGEKHRMEEAPVIQDESKESQWLFAQERLQQGAVDYFVFGHRHIPQHKKLTPHTDFINLGDWLRFDTYGEFDGKEFRLVLFPSGEPYIQP